jgi:hypothetical protein
LILGDPLCRPWGVRPEVGLNIESGATLKGTCTLKPTCETTGFAADQFEFFLDGHLRGNLKPGQELELDTTILSDGYHEFRMVAIGADGIQTHGHLVIPVNVDNHRAKLVVRSLTEGKVELEVAAEGAKRIVLTHLGRDVAKVDGGKGIFRVPPEITGFGTVNLLIRAVYENNGTEWQVAAPPVRIEVAAK